MTANLFIHLGRNLCEKYLENAAIVHVINVSKPSESCRNLILHAGYMANSRPLSLPAGSYVVQTEMPSGELRIDDIHLDKDQAYELMLDAPASPTKWLSFAGWLGHRYQASPTVQQRTAFVTTVERILWGIVSEKLPWREIQPTVHDSMAALFSDFNEPATESRRLMNVQCDGRDYLVIIPPFWDAASDRPAVEVIISSDGPRVLVRDVKVSSILAYIAHGNLPSAASLCGTGLNLKKKLDSKKLGPLQAAVEAYALISMFNERDQVGRDLLSGIHTLYDEFEWLPDGAIQYARLKLLMAQTDKDIDAATRAIDDAWERGIPYFSMGVDWMLELMESRVVDEDVPEQIMRLSQVRRIARQVQPGAAITTLYRGEIRERKEPLVVTARA